MCGVPGDAGAMPRDLTLKRVRRRLRAGVSGLEGRTPRNHGITPWLRGATTARNARSAARWRPGGAWAKHREASVRAFTLRPLTQ